MNSLISRLQRPGYDLQKEQAIQEAIVMLRQCNAQSKPDCGEAGHDEGRCGNVQCLPGAAAPSVPEGWQLVPTAESRHPGIYKMLGALHAADNTPGMSEWESYRAMLAAAPEAKP